MEELEEPELGVAVSHDLGWYFESDGITPPYGCLSKCRANYQLVDPPIPGNAQRVCLARRRRRAST